MKKPAPISKPPTKKSVVIVEDDLELQNQLVYILGTAEDIECTHAADSAEEALQYILAHPPDVVVMDIKLPGMSGINCVAKVKRALPSVEIVMLTIYEDSENIFRALQAGANGYLIKSGDPDTLLKAIRDVHTGGAPFSSNIARKVAQHFRHEEKRSEATEMLAPREQEVLEFLSRGYIYKEIADKLGIQTETVRWYVKNICSKMHVRSRLEAVAKLKS